MSSLEERQSNYEAKLASIKKSISKCQSRYDLNNEDQFEEYQTKSNELSQLYSKQQTQLKKCMTMRDNAASKLASLESKFTKLKASIVPASPASSKKLKKSGDQSPPVAHFAVSSPLQSIHDDDEEEDEDDDDDDDDKEDSDDEAEV